MKILYGVQGTGNGHISRASAMANAFKAYPNIEVTWLLSGRKKSQGCGEITHFIWRRGLTFIAKKGKISMLGTLLKNNIFRYFYDAAQLDLSQYDLIISDFEPVVTLAARLKGKPILGIGHQYAFNYNIPKKGAGLINDFLMKSFAPATTSVGLHWNHYNTPILPPIINLHTPSVLPEVINNKVIVYLPFESTQVIKHVLKNRSHYEFYIYHPELKNSDHTNFHFREISQTGFKHDLLTAKKVIANSGFELISECLQLGKEILAKPLQGQMEQHSNAKALKELEYATIMEDLNEESIKVWLTKNGKNVKVTFPNVSEALAKWIANDCKESLESLSSRLWLFVKIEF